ncbi:MAG TPA: peptide chain release factor-like protein [Deltaproteobacteria bacterium]|nr:peptide chain release factor-like protein [Deltaproteobacteria bacterium]
MNFPVSLTKEETLQKRMDKLGLTESDLEESFTHGSGAGGQKINKTSVVVLLKHIPTGLQVRCQQSRSQALNRFLARRLLVEKLEEKIRGEKSRKQQEIEKIRRQKRKRSKRAKEKMLAGKKHRAEKKGWRKKPGMDA